MDPVYTAVGLVLVLLLVWYYVEVNSIKVYRFHRPNCPFCIDSQDAWNGFVARMRWRMVKPIAINLNKTTNKEVPLVSNYGVKSVPTVVAVLPDGRSFKHTGERTVENYVAWVNGL